MRPNVSPLQLVPGTKKNLNCIDTYKITIVLSVRESLRIRVRVRAQVAALERVTTHKAREQIQPQAGTSRTHIDTN